MPPEKFGKFTPSEIESGDIFTFIIHLLCSLHYSYATPMRIQYVNILAKHAA